MYAQNTKADVSAAVRRELARQQEVSQKRLSASLKQLAQVRKLVAPKAKAANVTVSEAPLAAVNAAKSDAAAATAEFPRIAQVM